MLKCEKLQVDYDRVSKLLELESGKVMMFLNYQIYINRLKRKKKCLCIHQLLGIKKNIAIFFNNANVKTKSALHTCL